MSTRKEFEAWAAAHDLETWRNERDGYRHLDTRIAWGAWQAATEAAKRVPMTDEQITRHFDSYQNDRRILGDTAAFFGIARDIESHHGITGDKQ